MAEHVTHSPIEVGNEPITFASIGRALRRMQGQRHNSYWTVNWSDVEIVDEFTARDEHKQDLTPTTGAPEF